MSRLPTLASDVLVASSRRRTLWLYLVASTAVVGVLVLGTDLTVELRHDEPAGPLARTVSLGHPVVPGSVEVQLRDRGLDLTDDGTGRLGDGAFGEVDHARGLVVLRAAEGVSHVGSLSIVHAVSLKTLSGAERARVLERGVATRFELFGQTFDDRKLPPRYGAPYLLLVILFNGILVRVLASFFGVVLGLLATSDAVSSALEPGAAELLLSRPVERHEVVLGRGLGAVAFGLIQVGWLLGLAVVLCGLRFGLWVPSALLLVGPMLLKFAVLLGVTTLVAVGTRTPALGLAAAAGAWVLSFVVYQLQGNPSLAPAMVHAVEWAHRLLPQVAHLDDVASHLVDIPVEGPGARWGLVLALACAWVGGAFGLTALVVSRRDY